MALPLIEVVGLVVESYSVKNITRESDTLPASSAIAQRILSEAADKAYDPDLPNSGQLRALPYLAGVWSPDLAYHLSWEASPRPAVRRKTYVAPSFSWLSVQGNCRLPSLHYNARSIRTVELLDACYIVKGRNPWGEVSSGYLKLKGRVYHTSPSRIKDARIGGDGRTLCCRDLTLGPHPFDMLLDTVEDAEELIRLNAEICLLELLDRGEQSAAIVLTGSDTEGRYRRVGIVRNIGHTMLRRRLCIGDYNHLKRRSAEAPEIISRRCISLSVESDRSYR